MANFSTILAGFKEQNKCFFLFELQQLSQACYNGCYYYKGLFLYISLKQTNKQTVLKRVFFKKVQQHQLGTTYCDDK